MSLTVTETRVYDFTPFKEELNNILDKYSSDNDSLSIDLHCWAGDLLEEANEYQFASTDEKMGVVFRQLQKLYFQVAINPFNRQPLVDPVEERGLPWGRALHRECRQRYNRISPLDGGIMEENPKPHYFAKEVLDLAQTLIAKVPSLKPQTDAIVVQGYRGLRAKMDDALDEFLEDISTMELVNQESLSQLKLQLREREETLALQLQVFKQEIDGRVLDMKAELLNKETVHQQNASALQTRIDAEKSAAEKLASQLQSNLNRVEAASRATLSTIGQQIHGVTQTQKQTQAQLSSAMAYSQTLSNQASSLQSQAAADREALFRTQTQLQGKEDLIRQSSNEVEQLRALHAHNEEALRAAQKKLRKLKNNPCVVM